MKGVDEAMAAQQKKQYGQRVIVALLFAILSALIVSQMVATYKAQTALKREQQAEIQAYRAEIAALEEKIQTHKTEITRLKSDYDTALATLRDGNKEFYELEILRSQIEYEKDKYVELQNIYEHITEDNTTKNHDNFFSTATLTIKQTINANA